MTQQTLAFSPETEHTLLQGFGATFVDIIFVPIGAESWTDLPGSGEVRLFGDGRFELRRFNPSPAHPKFTMTKEDWEELQRFTDPAYH